MNALVAALMLAAPPAPVAEGPKLAPDVCLEDLAFFPSPELTQANVDFAREHKFWLLERTKVWLYPEERDYWDARFHDQYWRWDVWNDLNEAHKAAANGNTAYAIQKLRWVRAEIGEDHYYRAEMPAPCAVWHFQRSD